MASPADELLGPAAAHVSLALGGGLGAIIAVEHRHLKDIARRTLFIRWRTWAVTAPIFGAAVLWSRWGAVLFVSALSLQAMREYAKLVTLPRAHRIGLYGAGLACAPVAALSLTFWRAMPPVLLLAATIPPLVSQDVRNGIRHLAFTMLGFLYIPLLLTYLILIREHIVGGPGLLLALGTSIAASDVFAFVVGKASGRHRMASELSPNKTWEGAVGNLIGASLGLWLMAFALPAGPVRFVLPFIVAIGCIWGDLVESMIKRQAGAKDAGTWLPGFGGLLDRIDSMLFVLPLAYTVMVVAAR